MSLRPPHPKKLVLDDLHPADILLSAGDSDIDKLIIALDQGDYSHVTQYIGKISGKHMVVEATEHGIKYESTHVDMTAQTLVDVYRFVSPDGHKIGEPGWPAQPIIDAAMTYVGGNYAYTDLLMVAAVLAASEYPKDSVLKEATRLLLDQVQHQIVEWLSNNGGKTPMTCVQVATSAHWQAISAPPHKYGLQVRIDGARHAPDFTKDRQAFQAARAKILTAVSPVQKGIVLTAGSDALPLGCSTPRDLQTSPTLEFIGCLKDTRHTA